LDDLLLPETFDLRLFLAYVQCSEFLAGTSLDNSVLATRISIANSVSYATPNTYDDNPVPLCSVANADSECTGIEPDRYSQVVVGSIIDNGVADANCDLHAVS
jgi:hypothetical protein